VASLRVHVLRVGERLQPQRQAFHYPRHNADYGIEQDFLAYLASHPECMASSPAAADWHYLPVWWTRWHLNHDYGRTGIDDLQAAAAVIEDDGKTFTICQYDDGPLVDLGATTVFLGSRTGCDGHDAPLLSSPHRRPWWPPRKLYRASFCGRLSTHPIRQAMAETLTARDDALIVDGDGGPSFFVGRTLESRIALAPRGYGGSSFRFYEAMQLGVVPLLLGDVDTRPFKRLLAWDSVSLYAASADTLKELLDAHDDRHLDAMGRAARTVYDRQLAYGRWCALVLAELETIR
jgi:hypothetical protein